MKKSVPPLVSTVALELASQIPKADSSSVSFSCTEYNYNQFCTMLYVNSEAAWTSITKVSDFIDVFATVFIF